MQLINILAVSTVVLSTVSVAAPAPYGTELTAQVLSRDSESELYLRDVEDTEADFAPLARRAAWTRSQEQALQRAAAAYATLNAQRGHPGFNQAAWLHAQQEWNRLQAAKTANGSRVNHRSLDLDDEPEYALTRRAAWTRSQEAALQRAAAEYARLNALRGHPGFNQAGWLHAQQEWNRLQAAKTANGSRVHQRSLDDTDNEGYALTRRAAWTRSQEQALQRAAAEYARLNALRGHPGFNQAAWLRAQQEWNRLQAAKTANGSRVHQRSFEDDGGYALTRRAAWTRSQEQALQRAAAAYATLNAQRGHPGFNQAAWLRAQQEWNRLQAAKTANGSRVHTREISSLEDLD